MNQEKKDADNIFMFLICAFINVCLACNPTYVGTCAILYPIIGICWLLIRLRREATQYNSRMLTEFLIGIRTESFWTIHLFLWPFIMPFYFLMRDPFTLRRNFEQETYDKTMAEVFPTHGQDSAVFASRWAHSCHMKSIENESKELAELPGDLNLNARTACACGATVAVMATQDAGAAEKLTTNTSPTSVTSYGWITAVAEAPTPTKDDVALRFARVRTTVKDARLPGLSLFSELDAARLQDEHPNWVTQCFLSYRWNPSFTLSAGRIAAAPIWLTPPPFLLETIDYPRLPFGVLTYAVQADAKIARGWRVIGDISGNTGQRFDDEGQFDRLESSLRIERTVTSTLMIGLTGQASEDFGRCAVDFVMKTGTRISLKGAAYYSDTQTASGTHATVAGGYAYVGVRPFQDHSNLEFHAQADFQERFGSAAAKPLILTTGVRALFDKGKWSATADYQFCPSYGDTPSSGTAQLRLQMRF